MDRTRVGLVWSALTSLLLVHTVSAAGYTPTWVPTGVNPGQTYHLVFVTSTATHTAESTDISDYDEIVDELGDVMLGSPYGNVEWRCLGSTAGVSAPTHAVISGPVYRLDDTRVATGSIDFWDGALDAPISTSDTGATVFATVWTGSLSDGTTVPGTEIGGSSGTTIAGRSHRTDTNWVAYLPSPSTLGAGLYGISVPLTAVPEPSTIILAMLSLAAGGSTLRRRRRRTRDRR